MENNLETNIITTETVEAVTDAVADALPKNGKTMKTVAKVGGAAIAGAALWELVIKPVGRSAKKAIAGWKQSRSEKAKTEKGDEEPKETTDKPSEKK